MDLNRTPSSFPLRNALTVKVIVKKKVDFRELVETNLV